MFIHSFILEGSKRMPLLSLQAPKAMPGGVSDDSAHVCSAIQPSRAEEVKCRPLMSPGNPRQTEGGFGFTVWGFGFNGFRGLGGLG